MQGRRAFLQSAAAAAFVNLNPAAMGANEKVTLALIGGRNQGNGDALRAIRAGARFKTFCALDPKGLGKTGAEIAKTHSAKPGLADCFPPRPDVKGNYPRTGAAPRYSPV